MAEAAGANILTATKELKEARCSARHMVVENDALLKGVPKAPREAHLSVRVTVEERGAHSRDALRASMVEPLSVWLTEVERGVLLQVAPKVQEEGRIFVSVMVEGKGVNSMVALKVHKAALISARHMAGVKNVVGDSSAHCMVTKLMAHVTLLPGGKRVSVQCTGH